MRPPTQAHHPQETATDTVQLEISSVLRSASTIFRSLGVDRKQRPFIL
jgi:hypothetical protein